MTTFSRSVYNLLLICLTILSGIDANLIGLSFAAFSISPFWKIGKIFCGILTLCVDIILSVLHFLKIPIIVDSPHPQKAQNSNRIVPWTAISWSSLSKFWWRRMERILSSERTEGLIILVVTNWVGTQWFCSS